jgi:hypothetical protein
MPGASVRVDLPGVRDWLLGTRASLPLTLGMLGLNLAAWLAVAVRLAG